VGLFLTILLISSILVLYFSGILFKDLREYWKLINSLKEEEKEGPESTIELDK
jgi:hypothetical protein